MGFDSMSYSMMRRRFRNLKKIKSRYIPPPPHKLHSIFESKRERITIKESENQLPIHSQDFSPPSFPFSPLPP